MEQIIKVALAIIFALAAAVKFSGKTKKTFEASGYSPRFMYAIAFAEVLFSAGLFTPYDSWAAIGMIAIVLGAIATLIRQRVTAPKYGMAVLSLILLLALMAVRFYPELTSKEERTANHASAGRL